MFRYLTIIVHFALCYTNKKTKYYDHFLGSDDTKSMESQQSSIQKNNPQTPTQLPLRQIWDFFSKTGVKIN